MSFDRQHLCQGGPTFFAEDLKGERQTLVQQTNAHDHPIEIVFVHRLGREIRSTEMKNTGDDEHRFGAESVLLARITLEVQITNDQFAERSAQSGANEEIAVEEKRPERRRTISIVGQAVGRLLLVARRGSEGTLRGVGPIGRDQTLNGCGHRRVWFVFAFSRRSANLVVDDRQVAERLPNEGHDVLNVLCRGAVLAQQPQSGPEDLRGLDLSTDVQQTLNDQILQIGELLHHFPDEDQNVQRRQFVLVGEEFDQHGQDAVGHVGELHRALMKCSDQQLFVFLHFFTLLCVVSFRHFFLQDENHFVDALRGDQLVTQLQRLLAHFDVR